MTRVLLLPCLLLLAGSALAYRVSRSESSLRGAIADSFQDWETFKELHSKSYAGEDDEDEHMIAFLRVQRMARLHNEAFARGEVSYKLDAWGPLADLTSAEYKQRNGYRASFRASNASTFLAPMNVGDVPESIDWRKQGYVTPVKDQGQCGSCWAFSATGSLEGQHKRQTGTLTSLSEQNLVDCSTAYGNNGCDGGLMDDAFKYIKANKGIDTENSYPYKARDQNCHFKRSAVGAEDTGYTDIPSGDEEALKQAVATVGPISVAIDASHASFQNYQSGVYDEPDCSTTELDHGVLVVGYGTDPQQGDYWIVKNSWGPAWGNKGYLLMSRNKDNQCGIATAASYPLV
jgi:cathepsin L